MVENMGSNLINAFGIDTVNISNPTTYNYNVGINNVNYRRHRPTKRLNKTLHRALSINIFPCLCTAYDFL